MSDVMNLPLDPQKVSCIPCLDFYVYLYNNIRNEAIDEWAVVVAQVVANRTTDQEVPSLHPAGSWAFLSLSRLFLFSLLSFNQ